VQVQDVVSHRECGPTSNGACIHPQQTLGGSLEISGIGLHSGCKVWVRISPAEPDQGRYFVRTDLPNRPKVLAQAENVGQTRLSTELRQLSGVVTTVEHLLAALVGMGIDNAQIELDGPEVPLLDGSATPWVNAINRVGTVPQPCNRVTKILTKPIWVRHKDSFIVAFPAPETRLTYGIDFSDYPAIGNQCHSFSFSPNQTHPPHPSQVSAVNAFQNEIAPARTFGFVEQVEQLQAQGLIQGGNLDNALVCSANGWVNPPLRFSNEPVRHKLLDLIGDLSLLGPLPQVHVFAYKASHTLHTQLAQLLSEALAL